MAYRAPVDDLLFALKTHGRLAEILRRHPCGLDIDTAEAVLREAGRFAESVLVPTNRLGDVYGARLVDGRVDVHHEVAAAFAAFCEAGWPSLRAPEAFGGQGLPAVLAAACEEMWCSANLALSLLSMLTLGAVEALAAHASEAQKAVLLPPMCAGRWSGTMNLTEPQAGSDLAQVAAKAVPDGKGTYLISGQKIFITWGEHELTENIVHLVLARLPDAPAGVKGISLFAVSKYLLDADGGLGERNRVYAVSLEHKMGIHGSPTCVMQFDGAEGVLIGEAGQGLACMFTMMNHARLGVGIEGHAVAEAACQYALAYARERVQGRLVGGGAEAVPIIRHPDVRRMLLEQQAVLAAQRGLYMRAAADLDDACHHADAEVRAAAQASLGYLIPVVKAWCTDNGSRLSNTAMQVFGGMGYIEETGAAQFVRDVRITSIYEGTNGIQALDLLGRKTAADGGRAAKALLAEGRSLCREAREKTGAEWAAAVAAAVDSAETVVDTVLAQYAENPQYAAANACAYLNQMACTLGAVALVREYLAALSIEDAEAGFVKKRQDWVRVYAACILPEAEAFARRVCGGAAEALMTADLPD